MSRALGAWLSVLVLVLVPLSARADAIDPPPTGCPAGAAGTSSHEGARCAPTTCTSDASCEGWANGQPSLLACRPQGLCIARRTVPVGGLVPDSMLGATVTIETALAACSTDSDCPADLRCELAPRCVEVSIPVFVARSAGCSCGVGTHDHGAAGTLGLVLLAGLALRRSRSVGRRARPRGRL